jgi:hypothetical protein
LARAKDSVCNLKVLHVLPDSVLSEEHKYSGGAKGIRIFSEYLDDRAIAHDEVVVPNRSDRWLLKYLISRDLTEYTIVLIHYSVYVRSLRYLRSEYSELRILVRSHNAEFPHWFQHTWLWFLQGNFRKAAKAFLAMLQKGWGDLQSARLADCILAVTDWERDHYWAWLTDKRKTTYIPYFIPRDSMPTGSGTNVRRRDQLVCVMSSGESSFLSDSAQRFGQFARIARVYTDKWRYLITGHKNMVPKFIPDFVERVGFVHDPLKLLQESRAVALLTDYGFGFKTKILEATECGCWTLVKPLIFQRLPSNVRPYCIVVNTESEKAILDALEKTFMPLPKGSLNSLLRTQAYKEMDKIMGVRDEHD